MSLLTIHNLMIGFASIAVKHCIHLIIYLMTNLFQLCTIVNSLLDNVSIDKIARLNSNPFTLSKRNIVPGNDYDIDIDINFYDCLTPQKINILLKMNRFQ